MKMSGEFNDTPFLAYRSRKDPPSGERVLLCYIKKLKEHILMCTLLTGCPVKRVHIIFMLFIYLIIMIFIWHLNQLQLPAIVLNMLHQQQH